MSPHGRCSYANEVSDDRDRRRHRRVAGGALGVTVALLGASYWALVVQIVTTDVVMLLVLILAGAGIRPNLQLEYVREIQGSRGARSAGV